MCYFFFRKFHSLTLKHHYMYWFEFDFLGLLYWTSFIVNFSISLCIFFHSHEWRTQSANGNIHFIFHITPTPSLAFI